MAEPTRRPYRVVAVSLYDREADEADRCAEILKRSGWPKANRSLVVREALRRLQEDLAGKDDERVFRYFVDRYARRVGPSNRPSSPLAFPSSAQTGERSPTEAKSEASAAEAAQDPRRRPR